MNARTLAPLTGLAAIGCIVAGLGSDHAPTNNWPNARIEQWYASHGRVGWFISAYLLALAAPFLIVFAAVVRNRLREFGAGRTACTIVTGAGTCFAVTLLVGAGVYAAAPAAMTFTKAPAPSADVSRYLLGASYGVLVMFSAYAAALFALATSIAGLRTAALPRWLAIAGIPLSVLMLANALLPMGVITLWFVIASIALAVRRNGPAAAPRTTPTPVAASVR